MKFVKKNLAIEQFYIVFKANIFGLAQTAPFVERDIETLKNRKNNVNRKKQNAGHEK